MIKTPQGLSEGEAKRASELGPSEVHSDAPLEDLMREAGFRVLVDMDVTAQFGATSAAILRAMRELESDWRDEEGDALFEEEYEGKTQTLEGISEGLLYRSLIVASRPA